MLFIYRMWFYLCIKIECWVIVIFIFKSWNKVNIARATSRPPISLQHDCAAQFEEQF